MGPTLLNSPRALRAPLFAAGAGVAAYSLATRYRSGARGALSLDQHRALDTAQGLAFIAAGGILRAPRDVRLALASYGAFSIAAAALTRLSDAKCVDRHVAAAAKGETIPASAA